MTVSVDIVWLSLGGQQNPYKRVPLFVNFAYLMFFK